MHGTKTNFMNKTKMSKNIRNYADIQNYFQKNRFISGQLWGYELFVGSTIL